MGVKWKWKRRWRSSQRCTVGVLWADRLSRITCTSSSAGTLRLTLFKKATKSALVWRARMSVITLPVAFEGGEQVAGAVALVVMGGPGRGGGQHRQRRGGAVERLDLRFLVDGEHRGGDRRVHVEGDEVADLLHQLGVRGHLEVVLAPRLRPNARQISRTVVCEIPCLAARPRVDQCVASGGAVSRVSTTIASITSSPIVRAAPGPGRVDQPVETVSGEPVPPLAHRAPGCSPARRRSRAWVRSPSAQASTILQRNANACDERVPPRPALQRRAFIGAQGDLDGRSSATCHRCLLRCWSTTPDERAPPRKFPISQDFLANQPSRTLGSLMPVVVPIQP